MKELMFNEKSPLGAFLFQKMLSWLDNPARSKWEEPEKLIEAAGIEQGHRVLEMGCGSGYFTPALAKAVGEEGSVAAIDLHPAAVEKTRSKTALLGIGNVQTALADAHDTGFAGESFDSIILFGVVPAPVISEKRLAREACNLLKTGGTLAVWTLAPFWKPQKILKNAAFEYEGVVDKVHLLKKTCTPPIREEAADAL